MLITYDLHYLATYHNNSIPLSKPKIADVLPTTFAAVHSNSKW